MAVSNIIQLRQLLRDKFPGLRTRLDELPAPRDVWASGVASLDEALGGGFTRAAITEIIAPRRSSGSGSLFRQVIGQVAAERQFVALLDCGDTFDPSGMETAALQRLLWVRCRDAAETVKAADLVLRDGNVPIAIIDLALAAEAELRRIPSPTWYRFQRIVEERGVTTLIATPHAMISPAQCRVTLTGRLSLSALEREASDVLAELEVEVADLRRGHDEVRRSA